tara:strand:+ start:256 stop:435 length:180 start_codon:yes stop_codon:yes gene_type:complete
VFLLAFKGSNYVFSRILATLMNQEERLLAAAKGHHFKEVLVADITNEILTPSQLQHAIS